MLPESKRLLAYFLVIIPMMIIWVVDALPSYTLLHSKLKNRLDPLLDKTGLWQGDWQLFAPVPSPNSDQQEYGLAQVFAEQRDYGLAQVFVYVLVAPLAEEAAFRTYLIPTIFGAISSMMRPLTRYANLLAGASSILCSALLFGALHGAHWIPATGFGILVGCAYLHRRLPLECILAHASCNGILLAYTALTGETFYLG